MKASAEPQFAFIFGVNWLWHCGFTASFGVFFFFFHEIKCIRMTSFMEFMPFKCERAMYSQQWWWCHCRKEGYWHRWPLCCPGHCPKGQCDGHESFSENVKVGHYGFAWHFSKCHLYGFLYIPDKRLLSDAIHCCHGRKTSNFTNFLMTWGKISLTTYIQQKTTKHHIKIRQNMHSGTCVKQPAKGVKKKGCFMQV